MRALTDEFHEPKLKLILRITTFASTAPHQIGSPSHMILIENLILAHDRKVLRLRLPHLQGRQSGVIASLSAHPSFAKKSFIRPTPSSTSS